MADPKILTYVDHGGGNIPKNPRSLTQPNMTLSSLIIPKRFWPNFINLQWFGAGWLWTWNWVRLISWTNFHDSMKSFDHSSMIFGDGDYDIHRLYRFTNLIFHDILLVSSLLSSSPPNASPHHRPQSWSRHTTFWPRWAMDSLQCKAAEPWNLWWNLWWCWNFHGASIG